MLLEDFAGELDRPLKALSILEDMIELTIEDEMKCSEETRKILALLYTLRCTISSLNKIHAKYNIIIDKGYEKIRAAKAAL